MNTYQRLIFIDKMHASFKQHAFSQIKRGELWSMWTWCYLMGGEL